jgi:Uncharacterized conserved protein
MRQSENRKFSHISLQAIRKGMVIIMLKMNIKKDQKEFYLPGTTPSLIQVPSMKFIMVDGFGNPNDPDGEYSLAVELLYALSYTIKMGIKNGNITTDTDSIDYVVAPLEGLWWFNDSEEKDFSKKEQYCWISMIRQPDQITHEIFEQAKVLVTKKKPDLDVAKARFEQFEEGLCVQCMHIGPYALEPATIDTMDHYTEENGLRNAIGTKAANGRIRRHHEIYLSDPRKTAPERMKTILRHPVEHNERL